MEDVGVVLPYNILTYDLLCCLPSILDNIKQSITHSKDGEDIKPDTLIDHLEIHLNKQKVTTANTRKSIVTTMFTKEDPCCRPSAHNPHAITHTKENCWMIYPEKRVAHFEKKNKGSNVRSFSSFSFRHPESFVLNFGSSSHMVSDKEMFITLDKEKKGLINTSCGSSTLAIKGKGLISLKFKD
jgi:hypothetical protein